LDLFHQYKLYIVTSFGQLLTLTHDVRAHEHKIHGNQMEINKCDQM